MIANAGIAILKPFTESKPLALIVGYLRNHI